MAFYWFSGVAVFAGLMVISAKNPVHSVLYLILSFFSGAALFVLLGAEFLAMIMVIVYVGAVAVLFMFVVMMLDIDFAKLREGTLQYLPFGALIGLILLIELIMVVAVPREGRPMALKARVSSVAAGIRRFRWAARQSLGTTSKPVPGISITPASLAASPIEARASKTSISPVISRYRFRRGT